MKSRAQVRGCGDLLSSLLSIAAEPTGRQARPRPAPATAPATQATTGPIAAGDGRRRRRWSRRPAASRWRCARPASSTLRDLAELKRRAVKADILPAANVTQRADRTAGRRERRRTDPPRARASFAVRANDDCSGRPCASTRGRRKPPAHGTGRRTWARRLLTTYFPDGTAPTPRPRARDVVDPVGPHRRAAVIRRPRDAHPRTGERRPRVPLQRLSTSATTRRDQRAGDEGVTGLGSKPVEVAGSPEARKGLTTIW